MQIVSECACNISNCISTCAILDAILQHQRFEKHAVIGMLMDNDVTLPIAYLAIQYAGYIAMPINTKLTTNEITYILTQSKACTVITQTHLTHKLATICP